ncbi:MAG TPA: MFS transporter [Candidatus Polarisedimenticolia bacterium]|nr:MFS transporter [Candidatus Polarisedimenticolia bacterium]
MEVPPTLEAPLEVPATRPLLERTFAALGERDFRIFWIGQLISVTGTWMQSVAQGWLVLQLTGSPFLLGVAVAARSLPVLVLGIPAGVAADRFDRRRLIIATSLVSIVVAALLAVLTLTERINFGTIIVLAVIAGAANAVEMPARQSLVVELAGRERLANAIALNSLLFNGARVIGPAIAGLIVAFYGPGWAFAVNAASFVPVIAGLLLIGPGLAERVRVAARGAVGELVAYLRLETRISGLLLLLALQTTFASGHLVIGPAVARQLGVGAEGLGFLLAATGLGAVVAGLRLAAFPDKGLRWRVLVGSGLVLAAALGGVGLSPGFGVTLVLFAAAGFGMVTFNASANTLIQSLVAERLRGRVMSLYTIVQLGLIPAGSLLMGALADMVGAAEALTIGGALWGLTVVVAFGSSRRLRRL